jgi:hypothetical protein
MTPNTTPETWSLDCPYYHRPFPTLSALLQDIVQSGMDSDYPITLNGRPTGDTAKDYLGV